jgi:hypothetical protein
MTPGTLVEILEAGSWNGPHTVTAQTGRTPDHLVLINNANGVFFEHFADAPFNIRPAGEDPQMALMDYLFSGKDS